MAIVSPSVSVRSLLADRGHAALLPLEVLAGAAGLDRAISHATIQKTGLALAGYDGFLHGGRVLVFGESEVRFLESLAPPARHEAIARVMQRDIPCVLLTEDLAPPAELLLEADRAAVPVLRTPLPTPVAINRVMARLDDDLAPRALLHGVLLDVLGLGVLLVGESGIGKSECALDLVVRGHRLVADDAVEVRRRSESIVIGTSPDVTRHHMELRGIGVINVREMFGVASTRRSKRVELVVQLERWDPTTSYERLGLDEHYHDVLGVPIPFVRMPVAPGRNVAILVEVAARNQLLRVRGQHAARALAARVDRALLAGAEARDEPWDDPEDEG